MLRFFRSCLLLACLAAVSCNNSPASGHAEEAAVQRHADSVFALHRKLYHGGGYLASQKLLLELADYSQTKKSHKINRDARMALADVYRATGDYGRAKETLFDLAEDLPRHDSDNHFWLHHLLASVYTEEHLPDSVWRHIQEMQKHIGPGKDEKDAHLKLLKGAYHKGIGQYAQAEQSYNAALEAFKGYHPKDIPLVYWNKSSMYYAMEEYAKALQDARQGYALAAKDGGFAYGRLLTHELINIHDKLGNVDSALHYMRVHTGYKDTIMAHMRANSLAALTSYYALEEKEAEHAHLEQLNAERAQIASLQRKITVMAVALVLVLLGFYMIMRRGSRSSQHTIAKLRRLHHRTSLQNQSLIQLANTKDQLLSIVSHDYREPLNSLKGTLKMARDGDLDKDDLAMLLPMLKDNVAKTESQLDEILLWAESQRQGYHDKPVPTDVAQEAADLAEGLSPLALAKGISLTVEQPAFPIVSLAQPGILKVVLRNLIINAIKYSPQNSAVRIGIREQGGTAIVFVSDSGEGMEPGKIASIMDGKPASGPNAQVLHGLGLRLVKDFCARMDAQFSIESEVGKGTTVTFRMAVANHKMEGHKANA